MKTPGLLLVVVMLLGACMSPGPKATPMPMPMLTPVPTDTPAPLATPISLALTETSYIEPIRKQIYREWTDARDRGMGSEEVYNRIAKQWGITVDALEVIALEGIDKSWLTLMPVSLVPVPPAPMPTHSPQPTPVTQPASQPSLVRPSRCPESIYTEEGVIARRIHCGINIDPENLHGRPSIRQLQDLGATWVRFTFKDDSDGSYPTGFPFYDDLVQELNQAGINILMILTWETYPGKPAGDADEATWDAYIAEFATRCSQIAQHYDSQVQAYEIWNEPDSLSPPLPDYDPWLRPEVFGRLLRATFMGIKEAPSATVVMGGLVSGQLSYLEQVRASTGGELYVDAVGVHPYGRRPTEDWPHPDWQFGVLGDLVQDYYAVACKPIWLTEVGTDDTSVQDQFPRRVFEVVNEDLAEIALYVFWFCWSDGMVSPFGLVDEDGRRKVSYTSFQEFTHGKSLGYGDSTRSQ